MLAGIAINMCQSRYHNHSWQWQRLV